MADHGPSRRAPTPPPPQNDGSTNRNPAGVGFWALVAEDFRTHDRDVFRQGFWALFWRRFGNWRMSVRPKPLRAPLTFVCKR
jgi:serine O-acetyltransferase